jgi:hypothetical protein
MSTLLITDTAVFFAVVPPGLAGRSTPDLHDH